MNNQYCFKKLSISDLKGKAKGVITWTTGGNETGSMRYEKTRYQVKFYYGSEGLSYEVTIGLIKTPCNYGGYREWFICPKCKNNCGVVYISKSFACHKCYDVIYDSQLSGRDDKFLRIAQKIRRRLGASYNVTEPLPIKPIGMHWKTYNKLEGVYNRALEWNTVLIMARFGIYERLYNGREAPPMPETPSEDELWAADYSPQGYAPGEALPDDLQAL